MSMNKMFKKVLAVVAAGAMTMEWQCQHLRQMGQDNRGLDY